MHRIDKIGYGLSLWIALFLIIFISGCVSLPENQKYSELEERVAKIEGRVDKFEKNNEESENKLVVLDKKASAQNLDKHIIRFPSNEDIQIALKNAGFYDGKIDGQIGTKTRNAIKEFQKQNDLEVDGVVGKNTWEALGKFYYTPTEAEEVSIKEDKEKNKEESLTQVEVSG